MALEGADVDRLPEQWRDYRIIQLTGWTFEQLDAQPACRVDWMLAIDNQVKAHERERADKGR